MPDPTPPGRFAGLPARELDALRGCRVAVLGAAHGTPYKPGGVSHSANAPAALREASLRFGPLHAHLDFDIGSTLLGRALPGAAVDCGDVATDPADPAGNRQGITKATRAILKAGAVPILLGGDDSVPIPMFQAYEGQGPITLVQVDAHVDWGDEIMGQRLGYGSVMRRAAEMPWVTGMIQVGIRGLGSGTPDQIEDARAWGSKLVTYRDIRRRGIDHVIDMIPAGTRCLVNIDCDGLDPVVMPAVNMPTPGGLDYQDVIDLLHGIARKGRIVGFNLVEFVPEEDKNGLSGLMAAGMVRTVVGLLVR